MPTNEPYVPAKKPCSTSKEPYVTTNKRALYPCPSMHIDKVWSRDVQRRDDECACHVHASSYYYRQEFDLGQEVHNSENLPLPMYFRINIFLIHLHGYM